MGLETGTYVTDLDAANPPGTDSKSEGDNHIRLVKSVLLATLPNASRAFYFEDVVAKTTSYTIVAADERKLITGDTTSSSFTLTLPLGSTVFAGWWVRVMQVGTANTLSVARSGSDTINGSAVSRTLLAQYTYESYMWTGTEWLIISSSIETGRPMFSVHKNGVDQGVFDDVDTLVTFSTEAFDLGDAFNTSTSEFLPTTPGKYLLIGVVNYRDLGSGQYGVAKIFKNDVAHKQGSVSGQFTNFTNHSSVCVALVDANGVDDGFKLYTFQTDAPAANVEGDSDKTYFMGFRVGE